jgi:uncharacterized protein (TIGR02678 family)
MRMACTLVIVFVLLQYAMLARVSGDEEAYIRAAGDALFDVNRRVLAEILVGVRGPSLVETVEGDPGTAAERRAAIHRTLTPETTEAQNRRLRQNLTARLVDDPVVYYDSLTEAERNYLNSQRAAIVGRIREATGLVEEVRAGGIAMVDPANELSDRLMPSEGTEGHATLLLAGRLAEFLDAATVAHSEIEQWMRGWVVAYGRYWKKAAREDDAERWLVREALERLYALRLAEPAGADAIRPLPAIARYAAAAPQMPAQLSLTGE